LGKATVWIDGLEAKVRFDADLREYEGEIELPPTVHYEATSVCFSGRDLDELEANGREVLRATREAVLGQ
jgi:hypothetical protein